MPTTPPTPQGESGRYTVGREQSHINALYVAYADSLHHLLSGAAGVSQGLYRYTDDLLLLEEQTPGRESVVQSFPTVTGFLPADAWAPFLAGHPDGRYAAFLSRGIQHGFRIGFNRASSLRSASSNRPSATHMPEVTGQMIATDIAAGRLSIAAVPENCHTSPLGLIPKPHQHNKFRLIVDLSAPQGSSVNDGIEPSLCSLEYASVDQAARLAREAGVGALMYKLDLSNAYRRVPVHSEDHHLLGIKWQGVVYCDTALPFGLRSAPKLFTAVADGLAWAMACRGIRRFIHYLDDFFFCMPPVPADLPDPLRAAIPLCAELGLPVAPDKVAGPATTITFLGIEIDSVQQELRLPQPKLTRLLHTLRLWSNRRSATKRELQSLIGQLNHAAVVVRPGRTFMRHLIDTMSIPKRQHHRVRLNLQCKADIAWWLSFVQQWNGVAFLPSLPSRTSVVADASGSWGCGAYDSTTREWFQLPWPAPWKQVGIAPKELLPLVVAAAIWGAAWHGSLVQFWSDNQAVVAVLSTRSSRDTQMLHLLRCLFFFQAQFQFELKAQHVPGRLNAAADALSRNNLELFRSIVPQAPDNSTPIPAALLQMLLDPSLSWTSLRWNSLLRSCLHEVCQRPQTGHIPPVNHAI